MLQRLTRLQVGLMSANAPAQGKGDRRVICAWPPCPLVRPLDPILHFSAYTLSLHIGIIATYGYRLRTSAGQPGRRHGETQNIGGEQEKIASWRQGFGQRGDAVSTKAVGVRGALGRRNVGRSADQARRLPPDGYAADCGAKRALDRSGDIDARAGLCPPAAQTIAPRQRADPVASAAPPAPSRAR